MSLPARYAASRHLIDCLLTFVIGVAVLSVAPAAEVAAATPEARTALLIGNSGYTHSPLINPRNDARDLAKVLDSLGFEVEVLIDSNKEKMTEAIFEFGDRLRKRGGVGFFYYAGHGMEVGGENYLIPVGAEISSERYVKLRGVPMGEVTTGLANARNKMNIVVLDACRNNPFARSWRSSSRGLAVMSAPAETLIAYATEPGNVASDGSGTRNSPYAKALIDSIQEPGIRLVDVFRRTRARVSEETGGSQVPWQSDNLTTEAFYFIPADTALAAVRPTRPSGKGDFSLGDLDDAARQEEAVRKEWQDRVDSMEKGFEQAKAYEKRSVSEGLKVKAWERFAETYDEDNPYSQRDDQLRQQARQRIDALQPKYASLVVHSNVSGDKVTIDGQSVGPTGPRTHQLEPGRHVIKVEKPGYAPYEETVQLAAADRRVIGAELSRMVEAANRGTAASQELGTLLDTKTNLMWMRCAQGITYNRTTGTCDGKHQKLQFCDRNNDTCNAGLPGNNLSSDNSSQARTSCETLNYASYNDWRVPKLEELTSLVKCTDGSSPRKMSSCGTGNFASPTIDQRSFPNFSPLWFWSATSNAQDSRNAWAVHFYHGAVNHDAKGLNRAILCVRSPKSVD